MQPQHGTMHHLYGLIEGLPHRMDAAVRVQLFEELVEALLILEPAIFVLLHDVVIFDLYRLNPGECLVELVLDLVFAPAHCSISVIVVPFTSPLLLLSFPRISQQGLAFLQNLVVSDHFLVLIALILGE